MARLERLAAELAGVPQRQAAARDALTQLPALLEQQNASFRQQLETMKKQLALLISSLKPAEMPQFPAFPVTATPNDVKTVLAAVNSIKMPEFRPEKTDLSPVIAQVASLSARIDAMCAQMDQSEPPEPKKAYSVTVNYDSYGDVVGADIVEV